MDLKKDFKHLRKNGQLGNSKRFLSPAQI